MRVNIGGEERVVQMSRIVPSKVTESKPTSASRHTHGENLRAMQSLAGSRVGALRSEGVFDDEYDESEIMTLCIPSTGRHI